MKKGLTISVLGITYVIGDWLYSQTDEQPIHCVKGHPNLACEFYHDGKIEIRELYAFDRDFTEAFATLSNWDYVEPNPFTEKEIDQLEDM